MLAAGGAFTLALVAIANACGDDEGSDRSSTDTPRATEPEATTTTLSPKEEVEAAYLAYWEMLERLSADPDPDDQEIERRAYGSARGDVIDGLTTLRTLGRAARPGPVSRHSVQSIDVMSDQAFVRDCAVDDSTIVDASSDQRITGGDPVTGLIEAALVLRGLHWKVSEVETIKTWQGLSSCDD